MNRLLSLAVLVSFGLHGLLITNHLYRMSYDAFVHLFFADHYRRAWWELWEPRWYAGFSVASYPPLVHQAIGLLSHLIGLERAWSVVLLGALTTLPIGVYSFSRLFVGRRAAGYAALMTALLPSVALTAHTFGQLPTIVGLVGVLFGLTVLKDYISGGRKRDGALAIALMGAVAACHHGTLLFLPWGVMAICAHLFLTKQVIWQSLVWRISVFGVLASAAVLIVIWPFWQWGLAETMQTPIDHASRHNFLQDPLSPFMFFWPMYGPFVLAIPSFLKMVARPRWRAIVSLFLLLFVQGLGDTTPLPRWLYGQQWEWLTYDRFALWASVMLMPAFGTLVCVWRRTYRHIWRQTCLVGLCIIGVTTLYAAFFAWLQPTQPPPLEMQPVVEFLADYNRADWRYVTFGFGDQMAWLSILTDATTIDGSYHTARSLPFLRSSGIGQIDSAYWSPPGLNAIRPFLEMANGYGVRWAFVNLHAYEGISVQVLLSLYGWTQLITLPNGVNVWENPTAKLPVDEVHVSTDPVAGLSWGILPLSFLFLVVVFAWMRVMRNELCV